MCLIVIALNQLEDTPLIFLSNRDEFLQRPTKPMHWWEEEDILAGKDLKAGGTWLAISSNNQFAAVTNYRDIENNNPNAPSRGAIPIDIIKDSPTEFGQYVQSHQEEWDKMNGFNLLYHNGQTTFYYSNISKEIVVLQNGIYAISNAFLDTPWPKVISAKKQLKDNIQKNNIHSDSLIELLSNREKYPEENLPDTGVGQEWESILSPICIHSPIYGTRTHTIIIKDNKGKMSITEKQTLTQEVKTFSIP